MESDIADPGLRLSQATTCGRDGASLSRKVNRFQASPSHGEHQLQRRTILAPRLVVTRSGSGLARTQQREVPSNTGKTGFSAGGRRYDGSYTASPMFGPKLAH